MPIINASTETYRNNMSLCDDAVKFDRLCVHIPNDEKAVDDTIHGSGQFMFILRTFYFVIQDILILEIFNYF